MRTAAKTTRNQAIVADRRLGLTRRKIAEKHAISITRVQQIELRELGARLSWRPVTLGGHPDFHDAYDVLVIATPETVRAEDA